MDLLEAINERHTVRNYDGRAIEGDALVELEEMVERFNSEYGLHLQLVNGVEGAFDCYGIRYGKWTGVTNYIALVGKKASGTHENCGYCGEQIVLWAQSQGLRTGWVEITYEEKPDQIDVADDEELVLGMAIGYSDQPLRGPKPAIIEDMCEVAGEAPDWFWDGMECAVKAPTAGNQRLWKISWSNNRLGIGTEKGLLEQVDIGIAKYHFELGAGIEHDLWS